MHLMIAVPEHVSWSSFHSKRAMIWLHQSFSLFSFARSHLQILISSSLVFGTFSLLLSMSFWGTLTRRQYVRRCYMIEIQCNVAFILELGKISICPNNSISILPLSHSCLSSAYLLNFVISKSCQVCIIQAEKNCCVLNWGPSEWVVVAFSGDIVFSLGINKSKSG